MTKTTHLYIVVLGVMATLLAVQAFRLRDADDELKRLRLDVAAWQHAYQRLIEWHAVPAQP